MSSSDLSLASQSSAAEENLPLQREPALIRSASTYGSADLMEKNKICTSIAIEILSNPNISPRRREFVTNLTSTLSYGWLCDDKVVEEFVTMLDQDKKEEAAIIAEENAARLTVIQEALNMPLSLLPLINFYASKRCD